MDSIWQDIRYGWRSLVSRPAFTFIAVLALALGIGGNSAIFSLVNAVLLEPPPYPHPEQVAFVYGSVNKPGFDHMSSSPPEYVDYKSQLEVFEQVGAYHQRSVNLGGEGLPEGLEATDATASLFPVLKVAPVLGRPFNAEEDQPGHAPVAVISYDLWQRRFGGDRKVLERSVILDGTPCSVVGVMPPGFAFPGKTEVWTPISFTPEQLSQSQRGTRYLRILARLKPGVSVEAARTALEMLPTRFTHDHPESYLAGSDFRVRLEPARAWTVRNIKPALEVLMGAVAFVLLIACANVANLQLVRATSRQKELAIRSALGAGRGRLVRQLLIESLMLAVAGGAGGVLLAMWGLDALVADLPGNMPVTLTPQLDLRVLGFTAGLSILTGLLFGAVPAWHASRPDLNEILKEGGKSSAGRGRRTTRNLLVVAEIALSLVLLIGAGLMMRSFSRLQAVDPGFNPEKVLTVELALPQAKYKEETQIDSFYNQLVARLVMLPGVKAASISSNVPMSGSSNSSSIRIEGRSYDDGHQPPIVEQAQVTPDYFKVLQIPVIKGRSLTKQDARGADRVAVIDQAMAAQLFPGEDPLAKRFTFGDDDRVTIVGVVGHVRHQGLDEEGNIQVYTPLSQSPGRHALAEVRTAGDPLELATAVRREIQAVDPDLAAMDVSTLEQLVADSYSRERLALELLGVFALVALLLSSVGIYGVMSYSVAQRTHEIGIRMALGARPRDVLRLVVSDGLVLAFAGVGVGAVAALGLTRALSSLLFGVSATDPVTFAGLGLLLGAVTVLASYLPARRAARVDPLVALRRE